MIIVPISMNSMQYWITDQFLECKTIPLEAEIPDKQRQHLIEEHVFEEREETTTDGDATVPLIT